MKAKLSILGLYRWNPDVFKNMSLPEGVDHEVLTWNILEQCAELEAIYADPDYMQASIINWSSMMLPNWTKIQEALTAEYNPIWNKDGKISEINEYGAIIQSGSETGTGTGNGSTTTNETDKVAGFNSDNTHTREERSGTGTQSTTTSTKGTTSNRQEAHTDKRTVIEQGNIGVTESSAMVLHEVELRRQFNIYKIIAEDFKRHYCLMVY